MLEYEDRTFEATATETAAPTLVAPKEVATTNPAGSIPVAAAARAICSGKKKTKSWTRETHRKRGATKRAQVTGDQEKPTRNNRVVAHVYERDSKSYGEALHSTKRAGWEQAMREEIQDIENNDLWCVIKLSPRRNMLHTTWISKMKTDAHGDIQHLKARLVACTNEQVFGVDYQLTFAAFMYMSTVKAILALEVMWGVPAKHGDIPNS